MMIRSVTISIRVFYPKVTGGVSAGFTCCGSLRVVLEGCDMRATGAKDVLPWGRANCMGNGRE